MLKCNFIINSYIIFSVNRLVNVTIHFIATNESIHNTISFQNRYIYSVANLIMIKAFLKTALSYRSIMFLLIKLHILTIVYKVSIVRFTKVCVWSEKSCCVPMHQYCRIWSIHQMSKLCLEYEKSLFLHFLFDQIYNRLVILTRVLLLLL